MQLRVLVTGATGLVGFHTVERLLAEGHAVRAFVRSPEKAKRCFSPGAFNAMEIAEGDITDRASVTRAILGCDALVHAAAVVAVDGMNEERLIATNVAGVQNVIESALDAGIERIVHVSSLGALFHGDDVPIHADTEPHEGDNAYGRSKALAERWVRARQDEGAPIKTVYPSAIVGPDDPGLTESINAIRIFCRTCVVLTDNGFQLVDPRDLAEVHGALLEAPPGKGRFVVGGHFLPWDELADLLDVIDGVKVRRVPVPAGLLRGMGRAADGLRRAIPIGFPLTRESMVYATRWRPVDTTPSLFEMGIRFRPAADTLRDTVGWLKRQGHL